MNSREPNFKILIEYEYILSSDISNLMKSFETTVRGYIEESLEQKGIKNRYFKVPITIEKISTENSIKIIFSFINNEQLLKEICGEIITKVALSLGNEIFKKIKNALFLKEKTFKNASDKKCDKKKELEKELKKLRREKKIKKIKINDSWWTA